MELARLNLDTHKVVKLLQEKGYTEEAAEGFIAAIQEITLSGVATNQALMELKAELKEDIQALKLDIQKSSNDNLKFQLIQTTAIIGVMIALFKFFPT